MMTILVTVVDENRDWHLDGVRHWFFNVDWHVLLDVDRVRPVYWYFHGERHGFLHWVGNVLLNGVRRWHGHFDGVRHGFLNMDGHWTVNVDLDGVRYGLFYWIRHWFLNWIRHRLGDVYGVGSVDWDLYGYMDLFVDWVRSRYMNGNLHGVRYLLFNWVRSGHMYFDGNMYFLFYGVGLGYVYLNWNWSVDWNMYGVRDLFLNRVGLWYMHGYFHDLLYGVRNVFDNGVGLGNWYLNGNWDVLFNWVGNVFLYWVGNCYIFDNSDSLVHLIVTSVASVTTAVATTVTSTETSPVTASVSIAKTEESTFFVFLFVSCRLVIGYCHFLFCRLGVLCMSESQDSHQTGCHELEKEK